VIKNVYITVNKGANYKGQRYYTKCPKKRPGLAVRQQNQMRRTTTRLCYCGQI
jgi:hypothetical protein